MHLNYLTLTRQALYDLVWTRPMTQVAAEFGISDVALAKRCAEVDVPVPPRGWWAKQQAGHAPRKTPLPTFRRREGAAEEPVLHLPKRAPKPPPAERPPPAPPPPERIITSLDDLLPAVKRAARHYRHPDRAQLKLASGDAHGPFPRIDVSGAMLDRALALADRWLRACADKGWTLEPPEPPRPWTPSQYSGSFGYPEEKPPPPPLPYGRLAIGTVHLEFRIEERHAEVELPPSTADLARQQRNPSFVPAARAESRPLGLLRFVRPNPGYTYSISQRSWTERGTTRLEDKLGEIVREFEFTAAQMKARDDELAREAAERAERARVAAERERRRTLNKSLADELEVQAGAWHYARRLRAYVRAARRSRGGETLTIDIGGTSVDFLTWAERYVEEIDPLSTVPRHPDRTPRRSEWWKPDDDLVRSVVARWSNRAHPLPIKWNTGDTAAGPEHGSDDG